MSELRTDFKDEILQEGEEHRVYNIKRKGTDEVVESEVYLEKAYEALQEGDEFGAKDVNEIHGRLNGLAPQSITINGDFQINQRGQSEYTVNGYSLDMWEVYKSNSTVMSVKQVDNGVELYADKIIGYRQRNKYLNGLGKPITICCSLDGVEYSFTHNLTQEPKEFTLIENVNLSIEYTTSNNIEYGVWLKDGKKHTVNYLKIYEGNITHKNVKEDKGIALMRCQSKIANVQIPEKTAYVSEIYYTGENFPVVMDATPVIVEVKLLNNALDVSDKFANVNMSKYGIFFFSTKQAVGLLRGNILVSCEPL